MDIPALQRRLRRFAADRDWQPFQTPKNLAMAMTVEAAELLEIFQWLTPEQSLALSDDQRRHLGEELSDVLLYLVQIADHGGVDLDAAVERKLGLNAVKHPPKRS
jgi:NTP pyrophosphatase (non-canonical NTP hydrolase)